MGDVFERDAEFLRRIHRTRRQREKGEINEISEDDDALVPFAKIAERKFETPAVSVAMAEGPMTNYGPPLVVYKLGNQQPVAEQKQPLLVEVVGKTIYGIGFVILDLEKAIEIVKKQTDGGSIAIEKITTVLFALQTYRRELDSAR